MKPFDIFLFIFGFILMFAGIRAKPDKGTPAYSACGGFILVGFLMIGFAAWRIS